MYHLAVQVKTQMILRKRLSLVMNLHFPDKDFVNSLICLYFVIRPSSWNTISPKIRTQYSIQQVNSVTSTRQCTVNLSAQRWETILQEHVQSEILDSHESSQQLTSQPNTNPTEATNSSSVRRECEDRTRTWATAVRAPLHQTAANLLHDRHTAWLLAHHRRQASTKNKYHIITYGTIKRSTSSLSSAPCFGSKNARWPNSSSLKPQRNEHHDLDEIYSATSRPSNHKSGYRLTRK